MIDQFFYLLRPLTLATISPSLVPPCADKSHFLPLRDSTMPYYLKFYEGNSRLRTCHFDRLSLVSSIQPKCNVITDTNKNSPLYKSFYYRVHLLWNLLPLDIRESESLPIFRNKLLKYLWKTTFEESGNPDGICDWEPGSTF